jgi:hypothetical protein
MKRDTKLTATKREAAINVDDKAKFEVGNMYSRKQISAALGGSEVEYLPTESGRVVCGCLTMKHNPEAPDIIIPGTGSIIESEGRLFCEQHWPVPLFIKHRPGEWEYVGDYKVDRFSTDREEIGAHHKGSITPLNQVTSVIFLKRAPIGTE